MPASKRAAASALHHRVEIADAHGHRLRVTLTIPAPGAGQRVMLPVWIPGSYLVREFGRHLQAFEARQGRRRVEVRALGKSSWQLDCRAGQPLELRYEVYAFDNSVRAAWLDADRCFFNATSVCLRAEGLHDQPQVLELIEPAVPRARAGRDEPARRWQVATGLAPLQVDRRGFGTYQAADYDELADCPVEMGDFWSGEFRACGVPHRFVVAGAGAAFDGERLLADARRICETQIRFWHGPRKPAHPRYVFMLNVIDDGYGGLEHRNSTALICGRRDLPRQGEAKASEGYTTLLGLISHEYFHTWNVKRLRPAEFARYDYAAENYTRLLWFFEGFTSYYDDLLLRRAGLIDDASYVKLLNKTLNQVLQTPGRRMQSVAEASFDAWVKYYRQDENTPNATVSYYTKGALVALCFDLTLRAAGRGSLDDVMRALWRRCAAGPMTEDDFAQVLVELGGRSHAAEIAAWVHGHDDLPTTELLMRFGVASLDEPAQMAQRLGLRVSESGGIQVKTVLRGGAAEQAGFAAGDEWLAIELPARKGRAAAAWRLLKLDDLPQHLAPLDAEHRVVALVSRDRRLLRLPLTLPRGVTTARLVIRDEAALRRWLTPDAPNPSTSKAT